MSSSDGTHKIGTDEVADADVAALRAELARAKAEAVELRETIAAARSMLQTLQAVRRRVAALPEIARMLTGELSERLAEMLQDNRQTVRWQESPLEDTGETNRKDRAPIVWVPSGEFIMGSDHGEADEKPQRKVFLDGYWMYKYPVTVGQYGQFCEETGRKMPDAPSWGWVDDHPMVKVTWDDATAYADWAGAALPTEAQWEKAARGTDGRVYPWGSKYDPSKALCFDDDFIWCTLPVGLFPQAASPYDCRDMTGSVYQWCADWYEEDYYVRAPYRNPTGPQTGSWRSVRGTPWGFSDPDGFRCACRGLGGMHKSKCFRDLTGFRCVVVRQG